jgi:hypothetical protein
MKVAIGRVIESPVNEGDSIFAAHLFDEKGEALGIYGISNEDAALHEVGVGSYRIFSYEPNEAHAEVLSYWAIADLIFSD